MRVWIPINYREVHFPCQGDWKEGRDGTLCACRWAIGHGLSQGRPKTRLDMLRKPHCHETYSMTWPLLQEIEGQTHDATKTPPSYTMQLQPQKHWGKKLYSAADTRVHTSHTIICMPCYTCVCTLMDTHTLCTYRMRVLHVHIIHVHATYMSMTIQVHKNVNTQEHTYLHS